MSPSARPHAIAPMLVSIPFSYQPQDISSHWTACADSPPAEARLSAVHFNPSSEFAELIKNDTCKMEQTEDSKCLLTIAKALEEVSKQTEDTWSSIQFLIPFDHSAILFDGDGDNARLIAKSTQTIVQREIKTAGPSEEPKFVRVRMFGTASRICWAHSLIRAFVHDSKARPHVRL
eukprot:GHVS01083029.1.p1 GENE.GHVS01083029.1~~GHVS01083029.1.p1  ORF type:complete len:176 (-),score=9.58 GHVS01083029.1:67-594(-)